MTTSPVVGEVGPVPSTGRRLVWSECKIKCTFSHSEGMGMTAGARTCRICGPL